MKEITQYDQRMNVVPDSELQSENIDSLNVPVNIVITRTAKPRNGACTTGQMSVNGVPFCKTLERPFLNNQHYVSSIPVGAYTGEVYFTKEKHPKGVLKINRVRSGVYQKDEEGAWKMVLVDRDIPEPVEIHSGNKLDHTSGCILIGDSYDPNDSCYIYNSRTTLKLLFAEYFHPDENGLPDKSVPVNVIIRLGYKSSSDNKGAK